MTDTRLSAAYSVDVIGSPSTPAKQAPSSTWIDALTRHAPSLAERLRDCAAGDCEADAFSWCEWKQGAHASSWTAYECSYRHPREGRIEVTRRDERLEEISIYLREDFEPLREALASLPSVEPRGDGRGSRSLPSQGRPVLRRRLR